MSPSNSSRSQDPAITEALMALPETAAMAVRDTIRGLEAEAGAARALVRRAEERRRRDTDHSIHKALVFRDERDEARTERDAALKRCSELEAQVTALEARQTLHLAENANRRRLFR